MNELKPCPFCGGTAEIETSNEFLYWWTAVCSECRTGTRGYKLKEEAIAAWNRRDTPQGTGATKKKWGKKNNDE